jgi:Na+/melibiose symporter-like transporter
MFTIIPATLAVIGAVAIIFYKIDRKMLNQMEADLAIKHAERDAPGG